MSIWNFYIGISMLCMGILVHYYLNNIAIFDVSKIIVLLWTTPPLFALSFAGLWVMIDNMGEKVKEKKKEKP